jgi:signal transduction histidine kinase
MDAGGSGNLPHFQAGSGRSVWKVPDGQTGKTEGLPGGCPEIRSRVHKTLCSNAMLPNVGCFHTMEYDNGPNRACCYAVPACGERTVEEAANKAHRRLSAFPTKVFIGIVGAVCLGLAASAAYDFVRLNGLRTEYLRKTASDLAAAVDAQVRGPDRSNPSVWQGLFAESVKTRGQSVAFMAILDESGQILASEGDRFATLFEAGPGFARSQGTGIYIYDASLSFPRGGPGRGRGMGPGGVQGMGPGMGQGMARRSVPARLRVGVYSSSADFIRWQAILHLVMNGVAIITLLALARYFLRTLKRFLQLKASEESARHLTALGSMAATLAHEIRNPLGAMKGLTQLAQEDLPGDHKTQSLMSTVVHEAERLEQLVTDLLSFARPRDPQISQFDIVRTLSNVKTVLQPKLDAARIKLDIESSLEELILHSDESGLRQILLNVLLNAMDATQPEGAITVRVRHDEKADTLIVEVDDSGPGFGDRDPEDLFQPFATTKTKGTGLGLPISRRIAERLGGSMQLAGRPEGGARCTFRLPLHAPATA